MPMAGSRHCQKRPPTRRRPLTTSGMTIGRRLGRSSQVPDFREMLGGELLGGELLTLRKRLTFAPGFVAVNESQARH